MRLSTLLVVLLLAGLGLWLALRSGSSPTRADACGAVDKPPQEAGLAAASEATICLLNRQRTDHGLPPLRENALLNQASLEHSQDMVRNDYFEHVSKDGRSVPDRLRAVGYQRGFKVSGGENIAYGVGRKSTPAAIVDLWMHSPPHRADILRGSFTDIGIGIALGAPEVAASEQPDAATYTTDFGGVFDPSLPSS
jgi:uncharacterized protein YkwD